MTAKRAGRWLVATGLFLLAGLVLHPHDPNAKDMAEVAYVQTGQATWWPAHALLLSSYVLFMVFLVKISRLDVLPPSAQRVLRFALPIAGFSVLAMLTHLLLPLARDSVANSHQGWAFWVKDVVESVDGLWAMCVVAVAWTLGRAAIVGNQYTAWLGMVGGIGFAAFSLAIPLTGPVISVETMASLVPKIVPVFGVLLVSWTVAAGLLARGGQAPSRGR